MFKSAVFRLTAWYMLIIVMISLFFSSFIYLSSPREVRSGLPRYSFYQQGSSYTPAPPSDIDDLRNQAINAIRHRLLGDLIEFNIAILLVSGLASFWLARVTLRPIEESLDAQTRFTADASHELRTPLTAMRSEIEVALRDSKLTKDQARALLKSNLEEVAKLEGLSSGLLHLAQRESVELEDVLLAPAVTAAVARHEKAAAAAKVTVRSEVPADMMVAGQPEAITELFSVLVDNAIKYSHAGGKVRVEAKTVGGWVKVAVRDQGVGIKAFDLPHIFDRFYRADRSRSKADIDGYGLGLSIAQKAVHALGGTIEATSVPGKGAVFTVSLRPSEKSSGNLSKD